MWICFIVRNVRSGSKARRLQEVIVNNVPEKGDVINIRNIYNELRKSEVGRETLDYLMNNDDITVNFHYHLHPNEDGLLGRIVGRDIDIYVPAHPENTKVNVTKTLIHETTHAAIDSLYNTRKEEVICFMREVLHNNNGITPKEIKEIIREVNSLYGELPWR